ncbi:squalene synthase HpnC [Methylocapsa palsarum]|uniref:Squalene synthase HpnC n=1 Tax=Methylocapsa palsarum TaxID=1612308 RepID=A0A1I3VTQ8_9HYPH|nr:squalene synthase HpnC [Methylocapsa palsarum]SFJ97666.1 squalene synthase HpnC [Methylocapsa palsarum]
MSEALTIEPSKTHRDENFPVASVLIAEEFRAPILAYYRFARGADDVVDNRSLSPEEKLAGLDAFEATLLGDSEATEAAKPLRSIIAQTKLSPRHALDLLRAFRLDAVKSRYASFAELMDYCAYSAAPVGRFVLDVHGESEATWPASDALCSALQIINHMQDCGADYRTLDRVYIPQDLLAAHGASVEDLRAPRAAPGLRAALRELAGKTASLIDAGAALPPEVRNFRLCLETAMILQLARKLNSFLLVRDPLCETVHLSKPGFLATSVLGASLGLRAYVRKSAPLPSPRAGDA